MNTIQVSSFSLPDTVGGTQVMLAALSQSLTDRGHGVTIFRFAKEGSLRHYETARSRLGDADVFSVGNDHSDCQQFRDLYRNPEIERIFEKQLLELRPDVVHIHHLTCLSTGILDVTHRHRVPTVLSLWDFWLSCPRGQRIQDDLTLCTTIDRQTCTACCARLWPHLFSGTSSDLDIMNEYDDWLHHQLDRVDVLATPSRNTREEYVRWGLRRECIDVVPCGLDHDRFAANRCERAPRKGPLRIAYIGSVIPSKGAHLLLQAVQRLAPDAVTLDIHGEAFPWHGDHGYDRRLRDLVAGTHDVRIHGRYEPDDVPEILKGIDVLVIPGLWHETFCLTIREGFLAGVAVVATRLGAMAEAIEHGRTGLLFELGNVDDLAETLRLLCEDEGLRSTIADSPKNVATTEDMVGQFLSLYDRAIRLKNPQVDTA